MTQQASEPREPLKNRAPHTLSELMAHVTEVLGIKPDNYHKQFEADPMSLHITVGKVRVICSISSDDTRIVHVTRNDHGSCQKHEHGVYYSDQKKETTLPEDAQEQLREFIHCDTHQQPPTPLMGIQPHKAE